MLTDLVRVIQQEGYTYRDPITEFLEDLYVNFDFEAAQHKLRECELVGFLMLKGNAFKRLSAGVDE